MAKGLANVRRWLTFEAVLESPLPRSYTNLVGRWLLSAGDTARRLAAFSLITLGVLVSRWGHATALMRPLICHHIARAGIQLLPMTGIIAVAMGFVLIGQTVALLTRVGVQDLAGTLMVAAIVRELGPFVTAMLVLMRVGVPTVVELGTARATGEVEGLEAVGVDPVHFLVVPRVIGITAAVFALTAYLIMGAILSGYLFAFLQDVPLTPGEYFKQLALALTWQDFVLVAVKSVGFGFIVAMACCFQGLSRPLELREVADVTTTAVVAALLACVGLDALLLILHLLS